MKYKALSNPPVSKGTDFSKVKKQVVPNQAMSVKEIMRRFTRNEPLAIAKQKFYHDGPYDLEKVAASDLVDREEFIEVQNRIQKRFKAQEDFRKKQEREQEVLREAQRLSDEAAKKNGANGADAK